MTVTAEPILKVTDLNATFQNGELGLHVLDQIAFEVLESEFVCILGPSGSPGILQGAAHQRFRHDRRPFSTSLRGIRPPAPYPD